MVPEIVLSLILTTKKYTHNCFSRPCHYAAPGHYLLFLLLLAAASILFYLSSPPTPTPGVLLPPLSFFFFFFPSLSFCFSMISQLKYPTLSHIRLQQPCWECSSEISLKHLVRELQRRTKVPTNSF